MGTLDDYEDLPEELDGALPWSGVNPNLRTNQESRGAESDSRSPVRDTRTALSHKATTGDPTPVVDMLSLTAPDQCEYWTEVASELHAQSAHYDALEAWRKAKLLSSQPNAYFDASDMASSLWSASEFGDDTYLAEASANAYADAEEWQAYLSILRKIGKSRDFLLAAFWRALEKSAKFDFNGAWPIEGTCMGRIEYEEITSWGTLADVHILLGDVPKAFEAWAMMARNETVNKTLYYAIPSLIELARKNELNEEDYIP